MLRVRVMIVTIVLLLMTVPCFATNKNDMRFLPSTPAEVALDNGLVINFVAPAVDAYGEESKDGSVYRQRSSNFLGVMQKIYLNGVVLNITNTSNQLYVIRWAESTVDFGNNPGVPFLGEMKMRDAGNPGATPNTIIPPGQTITKGVYTSSTWHDREAGWGFNGTPIPVNNSIRVQFYLKILDANGTGKYFALQSPPIGM